MRAAIRKRTGWLCCAALLPALGVAAPTQADLVLYNGKIITVDDAFSIQSTLVVRGDKILAVGGPEIAARYSAPQRIDLHGRAVMPGFIDTHAHVIGTSHREMDLSNATSVEEVKSLVAAKARELGPGEWVVGDDYDETKFTDHRRPLRWDLDAAAPNNPVFLYRDGRHGSAANSVALKAAGITRNTPDTQKYVIEHYSDGEPNGFVRESLQLFMPLIPVDSPQQMSGQLHCGNRISGSCRSELPARSLRTRISKPWTIRLPYPELAGMAEHLCGVGRRVASFGRPDQVPRRRGFA